ncbi:MAG: GNAT family N-acetyltransferase [Acidobacteriota bacterium]
MSSADVTAPERLSAAHDVSGFDSGEPALDDWLRRRSLQNEASGASRTYVVRAGKQRVVGYYTLAVGAATHEEAPGRVKRNMPEPVPVMVLGRLAVDREFQRQGLGTGLLRDAVLRTVQASEIAGIRAILVHAISDDAKRFYDRYGFIASPIEPLTVMITIAEAAKILDEKGRKKAPGKRCKQGFGRRPRVRIRFHL